MCSVTRLQGTASARRSIQSDSGLRLDVPNVSTATRFNKVKNFTTFIINNFKILLFPSYALSNLKEKKAPQFLIAVAVIIFRYNLKDFQCHYVCTCKYIQN